MEHSRIECCTHHLSLDPGLWLNLDLGGEEKSFPMGGRREKISGLRSPSHRRHPVLGQRPKMHFLE